MIECYRCKELISEYDQFCKHCGAMQDVEKNQRVTHEERVRSLEGPVKEYIHKYKGIPGYDLLWLDNEKKEDYNNLSGLGHNLLTLELEKQRFEMELSFASPKMFEKRKRSVEIRREKIDQLLKTLQELSTKYKNISKID